MIVRSRLAAGLGLAVLGLHVLARVCPPVAAAPPAPGDPPRHLTPQSSSGCMQNGTVYGEGSAMVAPSPCEYCYCIKGKQHCVQPHCILNVYGCKPEYNKHSCCPIKYNCTSLRNSSATSTTTVSTVIKNIGSSCKVNGTEYPEGEKIEGSVGQCENCYCMKGSMRCEPIVCPIPLDTCVPVKSPGHCCPTSYNCTETDPTTLDDIKLDATNTSLATTVFYDVKVETESTTLEETTETSTLELAVNDTELRYVTESDILSDEGTTHVTSDTNVITTLPTESANHKDDSSTSPVRSIPEELEAIINRTLAKDEDYDYDYNESSLPPSLPNLKIIPFVAADAVVNEQDGYNGRNTEIPIYLDMPRPNRFSPPSKTEGGFVPREPVIDGPFYESKFGKPFSNHNKAHDHMSNAQLPPITEPPKLFEEGKCEMDGKTYHHGEVVSEPNVCELCVCYYRQIHCQKPKCNPVKPGCHRIQEENSCCGKEICGDIPSINIENKEPASSTPLPETMSNIPAITVADLIVTPNPFKDVIRTEPAPDLTDIMKDMLPYLVNDSSTSNTNISIQHNFDLGNSNLTNHNETGNAIDKTSTANFNVGNGNKETTIPQSPNEKDMATVNIKNYTTKKNSSEFEKDYENSFSFSSVLDMLFRGEIEPSKPSRITVSSPKPTQQSYNSIDNDNRPEQKQEINNAIEHSDNDYHSNNNNAKEKPNEIPVFNDYQADESRNDTKYDFEPPGTKQKIKIESRIDIVKPLDANNSTIKDNLGSGLLKLAGCNIYGRMYRVGNIISELSSSCLECMCTEFGVQCRKHCS